MGCRRKYDCFRNTTSKYSLNEISRIVEKNGAQISSFNTSYEDSGDMLVTFGSTRLILQQFWNHLKDLTTKL